MTVSSDVIAVSAPFTIYPIEYYYKGQASLTTIPAWNRFVPGSLPSFEESKLPQYAAETNRQYRKVWLILSFDQGYQEQIRKYYSDRYQELSRHQFSSNITAYEYRLRYDTPVTIDPI